MAEDKRLTEVRNDEYEDLNDLEKTYGNMVSDTDSYYDKLIDNSQDWADKQTEIQQEQTDFAIKKIEQQKDQAHKDYIKEQSGAYKDWQKQSNPYGVQSEQMAASGLSNSGYSESSQVRMYTAYQNRVASAREVYSQAVLNYDNSIKEAMLQNNAKLAEIAYTAFKEQLELGLQGFQYKNQLISELAAQKLQVKQLYTTKWQTVLNQINTENSLAEQKRQADLAEAYRRDQLAEQKRQYDETMAYQKEQDKKEGLITGGGGTKISGGTAVASRVLGEQQKTAGQYGNSHNYVRTEYFDGYLPEATASDGAKYGMHNNGYQPKGISGHGKLKKTGDTFDNSTWTVDGTRTTVTQNIWKAEDGTYWYWEGRLMKYIQTSM